MALDLGGTNFRVIKLVLQNGQIVEEVIDYFSVEESIRYNSLPEFYYVNLVIL